MDEATVTASAAVVAVPPGGWAIPSRAHRSFHCSRSSARSIEAGGVPRTSPEGMSAASLSGVWPPSDTMTPTSRPAPTEAASSRSSTLARSSGVRGSKYSRSEVS